MAALVPLLSVASCFEDRTECVLDEMSNPFEDYGYFSENNQIRAFVAARTLRETMGSCVVLPSWWS